MIKTRHLRLQLSSCLALALCVLALVRPAAALVLDLASVNPDKKLAGANGGDNAGQNVLFGDINGDGRDDLIIGAPQFSLPGRDLCGAIFIQIASDTMPDSLALDEPRDDIMRIYGPDPSSRLGGIMTCGDLNGDNRDEIICGIPAATVGARIQAGEIYVIFGNATPVDTLDLDVLHAGVTHILGGATFDKVGTSLAVGDVNNDTFGDIVAGAPTASAARPLTGKVVVVYGAASLPALIDLMSPGVTVGEIYGHQTNDFFGGAVAAGDVTGDAIDDIIVGAPEASPLGRSRAGISYIIPGRTLPPPIIDTIIAPDSGIVQVFGNVNESASGSAFGIGDYDGDTTGELAIGAPEFGANDGGAVYVLQQITTWPDTLDLLGPNPPPRLEGTESNAKVGLRIAVADFNMDGMDDIALGSPNARASLGRDESGKAYIVFGRVVFPPVLDLSNEQTGITHIYGAAAGDHVGSSVAAGRVDGGGFWDLLVGAEYLDNPGEARAGAGLLWRGSDDITPTAVLTYDAFVESGVVRLVWKLASDVDVENIVIERQREGGRINRFRGVEGVVRSQSIYQFIDDSVKHSSSYSYRVLVVGDDPQELFRIVVSTPPGASARLGRAYPNPFAAGTEIPVWLPESGPARLTLYDVTGARIRVLAARSFPAGRTGVVWDGRDARGLKQASGVYFVRLHYGGLTQNRKLILIR